MAKHSKGSLQEPSVVKAPRVVYVAGSGHSGSTLLAMLLDAHPRIVSVGETAVKAKIRQRGFVSEQRCSCGARISQCTFWQEIFLDVRKTGWEFGPDCWSNDYRSDNRFLHYALTRDSSHSWIRVLQRWAARGIPWHAARMRRVDRINVALVRAALKAAGADVFVDTTKQSFRLTRLLNIPELDVKAVTLVRDVRGYAASAKRQGRSTVADAARAWANKQRVISEITEALPGDRTLLVRYEDLCANLALELRRLHMFCGVDPADPGTSLNSADHHVLGNSMRMKGSIHVRLDESWRERLGAEELREIQRIAGNMNRRFGYE